MTIWTGNRRQYINSPLNIKVEFMVRHKRYGLHKTSETKQPPDWLTTRSFKCKSSNMMECDYCYTNTFDLK